MKTEIEIPPQYVDIIKAEAAKRGISADEFIETALRNFLERGGANAE